VVPPYLGGTKTIANAVPTFAGAKNFYDKAAGRQAKKPSRAGTGGLGV